MNQNNTSIFISKAIKIHGNRYDYSKVNYINAKSKITIICNIHGEFQQTPSNHLSRYNCQKCAKNLKYDIISFIEKANKVHKNRYDYSKVNYINANTPVKIICKEHGDFDQIPDFHINRSCNCPKCINNICSNTSIFIEKSKIIHEDKYDYSQVNYINSITPIKIICKKHGAFIQTPDVHIYQKAGCSSCINKTEYIFFNKIKEIYPNIQRQVKFDWCRNKRYLPFDFCIPEYNIIIEVDGPQHFKQVSNWRSPLLQNKKDIFKMECANKNGYSVIRVLQEDILNNSYDWEKELKNSIQFILFHKNIENIFLCKNNEYNSLNK